MPTPLFDPQPTEGRREGTGFKRLAIVAGSLAVTGLTLGLALLLGSWGYTHRSLTSHHTRLAHLVEKEPSLGVVVQALEEEGSPLVASPGDETSLRRAVSALPNEVQDLVVRKHQEWPIVRVFRSGDVLYVLFFDADRTLRDFACAMVQSGLDR
jgi:hypothetical protein